MKHLRAFNESNDTIDDFLKKVKYHMTEISDDFEITHYDSDNYIESYIDFRSLDGTYKTNNNDVLSGEYFSVLNNNIESIYKLTKSIQRVIVKLNADGHYLCYFTIDHSQIRCVLYMDNSIPPNLAKEALSKKETGMGYHNVSMIMNDGTIHDNVHLFNDGFYREPINPSEIKEIIYN